MANSTVRQSKWKPVVEPRRPKPKTYRQARTHRLKFYEEVSDLDDIIYVLTSSKGGWGMQYVG